MQWFRSVHGAPTDPKWLRVGRLAKQPVPVVVAVAWALMDYASRQEERGNVSRFSVDDYAAYLDTEPEAVSSVISALTEIGWIRDGCIARWSDHQVNREREDDSRERTQRYREKRVAMGLPRSGNLPSSLREHIFARDGGACVYCGSEKSLCLDHMVPINQGGADDPDNLAVACKPCNGGKSGRTPQQAGYTFRTGAEAAKAGHVAYLTTRDTSHVTVTPPVSRLD